MLLPKVTLKSLRAAFRPRDAVSSRMTRAVAAVAAVLELPRFRLKAARRLFSFRAAASSWNTHSAKVTRRTTLFLIAGLVQAFHNLHGIFL